MKIAVASGKGGTGKTTVATNLAVSLTGQGKRVQLVDCDVEEPNCHIFLKPQIDAQQTIAIPVPKVDLTKCTFCGVCAEVCEFGAIACLRENVLVFPELCHGCGGCGLFCPEGAITEAGRSIGVIEKGRAGRLRVVQGRLNVGEAMAPPLIRAVKAAIELNDVTVIDAPPGTSCPVIEAVRDADLVLLVTEPTPFGLHDLKLAVEMVQSLELPLAVVINRYHSIQLDVSDYCHREGVEIIMEIPDDRRIAEVYSNGGLIIDALPNYANCFTDLSERIMERIKRVEALLH